MPVFDWFRKKQKQCDHEYFAMYERCHFSWTNLFISNIFHLSCIHCGKGICHNEQIRYHGTCSYMNDAIRELYSKTIFTRLYAKYPIVNKLTKL